jgi:hypothetical protein
MRKSTIRFIAKIFNTEVNVALADGKGLVITTLQENRKIWMEMKDHKCDDNHPNKRYLHSRKKIPR